MKSSIFAILAVPYLFVGCAAPTETASRPKPGTGISEYRELTRDAHRSVGATVVSINALMQPQADATKATAALAAFDRAMENLELTSYKTRSRAEAILVRGDAYFEEWKEQLDKNDRAGQSESENYRRLHAHFVQIRERSGDVRAEFRPFMAKLRGVRAGMGKTTDGQKDASLIVGLDELSSSGKRVLAALESVSKALDDAETELRRSRTSKP